MAKVKNINGTSQNKCSCGSWLQHWKNFSRQSVTYCSEKNCLNKDLLGAHVQRADVDDKNWYIVPLCDEHNKSTGTIEIVNSVKLISANKKETCDK